MPKPFLELTLEQWSDLILHFPWSRKITEVHVHHTFRPNHADFTSRPALQVIEGMFRFHTEERHFSDIAQHVTIDPLGKIWTGRNWNAAPASATGFNGNSTAGPFMFEMIGDFDQGRDAWVDPQRASAIAVIARIQKLFGLDPSAFRFHNEMSPKSCPGTAITKASVLESVTAEHTRLAAPRTKREFAFGDVSARDRATTDRLLQWFGVQTTPRGVEADAELPEQQMTLREMARSAGDPLAVASRASGADDISAEDRARLRKHVINLRMGALSTGGTFQTSEDDVRAIFGEHIPAFMAARPADAPLNLVFFAHGGLNDELQSLKNARNRLDFYLQNGCYPIFWVWETGPKETIVDILRQFIGLGPGRDIMDKITDFTDARFESLSSGAGTSAWLNMKRSAEFAFVARGGGLFLIQQLTELWKQLGPRLQIHAIGHSAGSIFHAEFLSALCSQPVNPPVQVKSLHFLAPAITIDLFKEKLKPLIGGRITSFTTFTMQKDFELGDTVGQVYRKSLLYLVSRAFEDRREMPIFGLDESLRKDPDMIRFFGLGPNKTGVGGDLIFSVTTESPRRSSISKKHGGFRQRSPDDGLGDAPDARAGRHRFDRRIPGDGVALHPGRGADRKRGPARGCGRSSGGCGGRVVRAGRRHGRHECRRPAGRRLALCVGIDAYAAPNQLSGCVNDARDWAAALQSLGFEVGTLFNEAATFQGLQSALSKLVTDSRAGDVIVFQYAGHGTRVADLDGDEPSNRDSALCPVDFPNGGFLIDDDIRGIFGGLPDGVNLTCFFDCCHSGTITRLVAPAGEVKGPAVKTRGLHATPEMEDAHRAFRASMRAAAPRQRSATTMREVSFTACTDEQTAKEIGGHGQFTTRAIPLLASAAFTMTNTAFHERVVAAFAGTSLDQDPRLDCATISETRPLLAPLGAAAGGGSTAGGGGTDGRSIEARLAAIERRLTKLGV